MRKLVRDRPLVFIDTETTGLDPGRNVIVEIGAVRVTPELDVVEELSLLVNPDSYGTYEVQAKALEVNGLNLDDLRAGGVPADWAAQELGRLVSGAVIVGHNVAFDWGFVQRLFDRYHVVPPDLVYHRLDTVSMLWPFVLNGKVKSMKLDAACEAFGVPSPVKHRALADAQRTLGVYRHLIAELRVPVAA